MEAARRSAVAAPIPERRAVTGNGRSGRPSEEQTLAFEIDWLRRERAALMERIAAAEAVDTEREERIEDLRLALGTLTGGDPPREDDRHEGPPGNAGRAFGLLPPASRWPNGNGGQLPEDRRDGYSSRTSAARRTEPSPVAPSPSPDKESAYWGTSARPRFPQPEWETEYEPLPPWPKALTLRWRLHRRRA